MRNGSGFTARSACKHNFPNCYQLINCFGHRKFLFFLLQAETICQQTSLFTAREYWRLAFDFLVYSKLTVCLQALPGTACQNKALTDRWLGSCCIMAINISAIFVYLMPHFVAWKYPKYWSWSPAGLAFSKNWQLKINTRTRKGLETTYINQISSKMELCSVIH